MDYPPVIALIITYKRLNLALQTIRSVKQYVDYPNIGFHIADDGSGEDHVNRLCQEIGGSYSITVSDAKRAGVGTSMNLGMKACLERADMWLHMEDDWVLNQPLDLRPCVQLLVDEPTIGMIRLGRLSAGLKGVIIPAANKLWWLLERNGDTYTFAGHASLRHRRFYEAYGDYPTDLPPGQTELGYCGKFNNNGGPNIVWPAWLADAQMGGGQTFFHIGDHQSFKWWQESAGLTAEQAAERFADIEKEAMAAI